jgi:hypothetical protein
MSVEFVSVVINDGINYNYVTKINSVLESKDNNDLTDKYQRKGDVKNHQTINQIRRTFICNAIRVCEIAGSLIYISGGLFVCLSNISLTTVRLNTIAFNLFTDSFAPHVIVMLQSETENEGNINNKYESRRSYDCN